MWNIVVQFVLKYVAKFVVEFLKRKYKEGDLWALGRPDLVRKAGYHDVDWMGKTTDAIIKEMKGKDLVE